MLKRGDQIRIPKMQEQIGAPRTFSCEMSPTAKAGKTRRSRIFFTLPHREIRDLSLWDINQPDGSNLTRATRSCKSCEAS